MSEPSLKQAILRLLPPRLVLFMRRTREAGSALPSALRESVRLEALREVLGSIFGRQRVPMGSLGFFQRCFTLIDDRITPCVLVDVGAADGWFVQVAHRFLKSRPRIFCYEPLRSKQNQLQALALEHPSVAFTPVALGDARIKLWINETRSTGLSSLRALDPHYAYYRANYDTSVAARYEVDVRRLDDELDSLALAEDNIVVKIDTQGFELQVLRGGERWLKSGRVKLLLLELMTVRKYEGASLYGEVLRYAESLGFSVFDIYPGVHEANGYLSEFDVALVHSSVPFPELFSAEPAAPPPASK